MKTLSLSNACRPLAAYAKELDEEILVLTESDRPVAAIVPLKGVDRECLALSAHPEFLAIIERSRAEFAAGRSLSLDQMKKAVLKQPRTQSHLRPKASKRKDRTSRNKLRGSL